MDDRSNKIGDIVFSVSNKMESSDWVLCDGRKLDSSYTEFASKNCVPITGKESTKYIQYGGYSYSCVLANEEIIFFIAYAQSSTSQFTTFKTLFSKKATFSQVAANPGSYVGPDIKAGSKAFNAACFESFVYLNNKILISGGNNYEYYKIESNSLLNSSLTSFSVTTVSVSNYVFFRPILNGIYCLNSDREFYYVDSSNKAVKITGTDINNITSKQRMFYLNGYYVLAGTNSSNQIAYCYSTSITGPFTYRTFASSGGTNNFWFFFFDNKYYIFQSGSLYWSNDLNSFSITKECNINYETFSSLTSLDSSTGTICGTAEINGIKFLVFGQQGNNSLMLFSFDGDNWYLKDFKSGQSEVPRYILKTSNEVIISNTSWNTIFNAFVVPQVDMKDGKFAFIKVK